MTFQGVASVPLLAQTIRVAEPWTTQSRVAAVGLVLILGFAIWAAVRVRRRG